MDRQPVLRCLVLAAAAAVLCGCSGGGRGAPAPTASSTPPAVQRTVAAGATVTGADPVAGLPSRHEMPDGHAMSGMAMPGSSAPGRSAANSIVPNGSGSRAVAAPDVDGCNRAYGRVSQCVPARAPGGGPVTCAFLRTYRFLPLLVTRDPLRLVARGGATAQIVAGKRYITGCSTSRGTS